MGGIEYASCTSMLVAIETVFQTIIYCICEMAFFRGGGDVMYR